MTSESSAARCGDYPLCSHDGWRNRETGCCSTCPLKPGGSLHTLANGLRWHRRSPQ